MITTTLNKIREKGPCRSGWKTLLKHLGKTRADDESLPLVTILDSNGYDDCLWALQCCPEYNNLWRKFAVWCARQVQHLMTDPHSINALDVAWRHSEGQSTDEELASAWAAACAAANASECATEWTAARAVAWPAAWLAASQAARDAASDAASDAARDAQATKLRQILTAGGWVDDEATPCSQ